MGLKFYSDEEAPLGLKFYDEQESDADKISRLESEKAEMVEALERLYQAVRDIEITSQWYKTMKELREAEQKARAALARVKEGENGKNN